jgi:2-polyprenyl-3-methyl-5-hydroxy-6-metoxy-1,4-benzoquinol methylase
MRCFDCHETEEMDRPQPAGRELETTLRELEALNRRFGGHRYPVQFMARRFQSLHTYRVLDLGTGGGDFPRAMVDWARNNKIQLVIDGVDASEAVVELARRFSVDYPEIAFKVGKAETFEAPHYYDLVHCSLSMHHFSTSDAVEVLRRCRDLSREYVLITDLERSLWAKIAVHVGNVISGNHRMTVTDGDTSARRAFSFKEFRALAKGAGWPEFGHERFAFCRQALWLPA